MTLVLTIIFGVTTLIGLAATIYYGVKASRLQTQLKTVDWTDVKIGAGDLARRIKRDFTPDLILTPAIRGGVIALFLSEALGRNMPIFVCVTEWREDPIFPESLEEAFATLTTAKWQIHIPRALFAYSHLKLLIVDDLALGGDALMAMKDCLVENGFSQDALRTVTLVATEAAIQNRKAPDYFWRETNSARFYFPWGEAR